MTKITNIKQQAIDNENFRKVIETSEHTQIVLMHIPAGGEIGSEVHSSNDQILYLASGNGKVYLNDEEIDYNQGDTVLVRAGVKHNFVASADTAMKIITTYSPPHHAPGTIHETKAVADIAELNEH